MHNIERERTQFNIIDNRMRNFSTAQFRPAPAAASSSNAARPSTTREQEDSETKAALQKALSDGAVGLGVALTTLGSFMVTFFWHYRLFHAHYTAIGYYKHTKTSLLLIALFVQSIVTNVAFAVAPRGVMRKLVVPAVAAYHFSAHVLAYAARGEYDWGEPLLILLLLEASWCTVHFVVMGLILAAVHSSEKPSAAAAAASKKAA